MVKVVIENFDMSIDDQFTVHNLKCCIFRNSETNTTENVHHFERSIGHL